MPLPPEVARVLALPEVRRFVAKAYPLVLELASSLKLRQLDGEAAFRRVYRLMVRLSSDERAELELALVELGAGEAPPPN